MSMRNMELYGDYVILSESEGSQFLKDEILRSKALRMTPSLFIGMTQCKISGRRPDIVFIQ